MIRNDLVVDAFLMPGGSRGDLEVGAAVVVTRLACRHM